MDRKGIAVFLCLLICISAKWINPNRHQAEDDETWEDVDDNDQSRFTPQLGPWEQFHYNSVQDKDNINKPSAHKADASQKYLDASVGEDFSELSTDFFTQFRPYDEMIAYLKAAVLRCSGRCELLDIGRSYEGRPTLGIKISSLVKDTREKRKMWIDAGIHSREWIAHSSALYVINTLIEKYETDPYVRHMVDTYEWYIFPCVNPDGYNYTWTADRMWRKTRSVNPGSSCVGVDANRNFGYKWGTRGMSSDPCSNNYRGSGPFSEPETRNIRDFIMARNGTWLMYISLHSKSQMVMSPWGYTRTRPADYKDLTRVGWSIAYRMSETHRMKYRFGAASRILYMSSGTSRDWARGGARIKYAYTIELRDRNTKTWIIPPQEILPTGEELFAGIAEGVQKIESRPQGEQYDVPLYLLTTPAAVTPIDFIKKYSGNRPISW